MDPNDLDVYCGVCLGYPVIGKMQDGGRKIYTYHDVTAIRALEDIVGKKVDRRVIALNYLAGASVQQHEIACDHFAKLQNFYKGRGGDLALSVTDLSAAHYL